MGVYIGDVYVPFVSTFSVDKAAKPTEQIKHLGNVPLHIAEFQSDALTATFAGTLFSVSGDVRSADQYAEDLNALVDRFGVYNYINAYQNRSGWLVLSSGDSEKSADSVLIREYTLSGQFLPKNKYQPRMHTAPLILTNDFSLTLGADGCDNYVPLPIGATYSGGDGSTITRVGADGTTTLVLATTANDIKWDLAADEVDVGECKVWDDMNEAAEADWVRVFSPDHVFTGKWVAENGLVRIKQNTDFGNKDVDLYAYYSAAWNKVGVLAINLGSQGTQGTNDSFENSSDKIKINKYLNASNFDYNIIISRGEFNIEITDADVNPYGIFYSDALTHRFIYESDVATVWDALMVGANQAMGVNQYYLMFGTGTLIYDVVSNPKTITGGNAYYTATKWQRVDLTRAVTTNPWYRGIGLFDCSNLFKECEAMTQGAGVAYYTGADASPKTGNTGSILNAQNENIYYEFTGGTDLPLGTYKLFLRAQDSAQVADDISCLVRNTTDSTDVMAETTKTLTAAFAYYSFDVTIASDDDTDTIRVTLNKETASANTIDLDYVLFVPTTLESGNGPQDIAHQAMVDSRLMREIVAR